MDFIYLCNNKYIDPEFAQFLDQVVYANLIFNAHLQFIKSFQLAVILNRKQKSNCI